MDYWDIGAPTARWVDLISERVRREQISRTDVLRVYALVTAAMHDATIAAWYSKYVYNRPRPSDVDTTLAPRVAVPKSPSYPSEYAATAALRPMCLPSSTHKRRCPYLGWRGSRPFRPFATHRWRGISERGANERAAARLTRGDGRVPEILSLMLGALNEP